MSLHPLPLAALCAVLHSSIAFAQGSTQSGENGGGNGTPSIDPNASAATSAPASENAAGASGGSNDIGGLSGGTIAAIIVVAIVVVLGAVAGVVVCYLARKRHWEVKKSMKRATRRLTGKFNNGRARFSRHQKVMPKPQPRDLEKGITDVKTARPPRLEESSRAKPTALDLEKGNMKVTSTFDMEPPTPRDWRQKVAEKYGK